MSMQPGAGERRGARLVWQKPHAVTTGEGYHDRHNINDA